MFIISATSFKVRLKLRFAENQFGSETVELFNVILNVKECKNTLFTLKVICMYSPLIKRIYTN